MALEKPNCTQILNKDLDKSLSMGQSKPSYFGILPASVRYDKTIPAGAKVLYSELTALCSKEGFCWASNGYFAELYDVTKMTISTWIKSLSDSGHIKVDYNNGDKNNTYRKIYIGIPKNLYTPIEKPITPPIEKPITTNTSNNNTSNNISSPKEKKKGEETQYFNQILKWFFDNNPDFSMDKKKGGIIKDILKKCNGGGYHKFEEIANKFLKLKDEDVDGKWWGSMPTTPDVISGKWDYIISAKFKVKPKIESVEDYY
jgi:hypothetical protein